MISPRFPILIGLIFGWHAFISGCSPSRPHENGVLVSSNDDKPDAPGGSANHTSGDTDNTTTGDSGFGGRPETPTTEEPEEPIEACPAPKTTNREFSKAALLESIGQCAAQRYCEFSVRAQELSARATSYVDSKSQQDLEELEAAYRRAIEDWSRAELFQFGPAASNSRDPVHGKGLRDLIYSWPYVSRCRTEEQLFGGDYNEYGFDNLVKVPINSRGLFAIEYLIFNDAVDNDCTSFSIVNAGEAWSSLNTDELVELKHSYLKEVSSDVARRAEELASAWSPEEGNFVAVLTKNEGYDDQLQALNIVAHAFLYVEREIKDYKLGHPAGLYADAPVGLAENAFALQSTALIEANLAGFEDLFVGCNAAGLGFDDWLIEAGHSDLALDIVTALQNAKQTLGKAPDLHTLTIDQLIELHTSIKKLSDLLKSDLFGQGSPLGLTLPTALEGDTD